MAKIGPSACATVDGGTRPTDIELSPNSPLWREVSYSPAQAKPNPATARRKPRQRAEAASAKAGKLQGATFLRRGPRAGGARKRVYRMFTEYANCENRLFLGCSRLQQEQGRRKHGRAYGIRSLESLNFKTGSKQVKGCGLRAGPSGISHWALVIDHCSLGRLKSMANDQCLMFNAH